MTDAPDNPETPKQPAPRRRFPPWLRKRIPAGGRADAVRNVLHDLGLATVCSGAHCPNMGECFSCGTATFMIMGRVCTRNCGFCAVRHEPAAPLEADEPDRIAEAVERMGLRYVVVTSVTRDDLPDGGAAHFARTIAAVRARCDAQIEVLTPDFQGDMKAVETVLDARPNVFNHNMETVPRLYARVRPQADYAQSLTVLAHARRCRTDVFTKSGLMVGLGETDDEVAQVMRDLRGVGCDLLTLGQYLQPTKQHLPVERFVPPEIFEDYARAGRAMGFAAVAAGPFVRSSYRAQDLIADAAQRRENDHARGCGTA